MQNFRGVTLYQPAGIQNMSHIIAMFDSGAGVEVMSTSGRMIVHTYLPVTFLNGTTGLLGHYSRNRDDDLQTPEGKAIIPWRSTTEDIHRRFGSTWRLLEGTAQRGKGASLFWHDAVRFAHYDDAGFNPNFEMPPELAEDKRHLQQDMQSICGSDSVTCIFDYVVTGDRQFAKITKVHEAWAHMAYAASQHQEIRFVTFSKGSLLFIMFAAQQVSCTAEAAEWSQVREQILARHDRAFRVRRRLSAGRLREPYVPRKRPVDLGCRSGVHKYVIARYVLPTDRFATCF